MTPTHRQQVDSWGDTAIKLSIPVLVATLVGVAGILRSHDNRIVGLERDSSHIAASCQMHREAPHPPAWVAEAIKEIRDDLKVIRRDVAEIGRRQARQRGDSATNGAAVAPDEAAG